MKKMILVRGIPGSGKSTVAEYISLSNNGVICCADDYFMIDGEYKWDASKIGSAHDWCKNKAEKAMIDELDVIISNTTTTEKEIKSYTDLAEKYGYMVISLIVENRHGGKNVHNVPDETLEKMKNRFSIKLL